MKRLKGAIAQQLNSKIGRSAAWMFQGQAVQLVAQFGYFVIIARVLGPTGYGAFVASTAVVLALAPFSPMGAGQVMMKYASRDRSQLNLYFGNSIFITVISGICWAVVLQFLRGWLLPASVSVGMLLCVALSDLICTQLTANCSLAFLAMDRPRQAASATLSGSVLRFFACLLLLCFSPSPALWARFYLCAALMAALYQIWSVIRACGRPKLALGRIPASLGEGFHFATSFTAQTVYDNIDKTQLARMASVEAAAVYAVAYRFVDASVVPIRALAASTYTEYFRKGEGGVTATAQFARKIMRRSVPYGLVVSLMLFCAAGLVPWVMGPKYADSVEALRWLSPLPLIKSVHAFLTDILTGANRQSERSYVQIGIAIFNVVINLWLIRQFTWRGAAWSSVATDTLLMVSLYTVIRWRISQERRSRIGSSVPPPPSSGEKKLNRVEV